LTKFYIAKMIFLDTSFLVAFYNKDDYHYNKAIKIMQELVKGKYGDVAISDYIFNECVTVLFSRLRDLQKTIMVCENIKKIKIFKIDEDVFEESWEIFKNQKENTQLSFTDCSILALMKRNNIKTLATFDDDFLKIKDIDVIGGGG